MGDRSIHPGNYSENRRLTVLLKPAASFEATSSCSAEEALHRREASDTGENSHDRLQYWNWTGKWCQEYFDSEQEDLIKKGYICT